MLVNELAKAADVSTDTIRFYNRIGLIEAAAREGNGYRHFAPRDVNMRYDGRSSFRDTIEAVRDGSADFALLPIENTTAGSINETYDLLAEMNLAIVGEEVVKVDHCLIALEELPVSRIRRIYSHPQALGG